MNGVAQGAVAASMSRPDLIHGARTMFRWSFVFLAIAAAAALAAFSDRSGGAMHLGLYIAILCLILAIGAVLLRRRAGSGRKP